MNEWWALILCGVDYLFAFGRRVCCDSQSNFLTRVAHLGKVNREGSLGGYADGSN